MEDDDEFGDLYTDVLLPFGSSSSSNALQPQQGSAAPASIHRPIDLNLQSDDEEIVKEASQPNPNVPRPPTNQTLAPYSSPAGAADSVPDNSIRHSGVVDDAAGGTRVLEAADAKLREAALEDANYGAVSDNDGFRQQVGGKDEELMEKDVNFDIEEGNTGMDDDAGSEPLIPGLASSVPLRGSAGDIENVEASRRDRNIGGDEDGDGGGDDWDSDSEDDLQIVLNDNDHGPMAMERGGMAGGDQDDDEDEDGLVIVTEGDPNQPLEEQDWGEDAAQAADGERKETVEGGKTGAGIGVAPKVGYSSHGYHPFHSQFKVSVLI